MSGIAWDIVLMELLLTVASDSPHIVLIELRLIVAGRSFPNRAVRYIREVPGGFAGDPQIQRQTWIR